MTPTIKKFVSLLGKQFKERKLTLVTAESCTGGMLAYCVSINSDASAILERGYVTYSNHAKLDLLDVTPFILQTKGAVSEEVAIQMAKGALKNSAGQVAIAITGIAGPDRIGKGHGQEKGVVWISCCSSIDPAIVVKKKLIGGERDQFCDVIVLESLKILLSYIKRIK